jgi:hypothetical protein
MAESVFLVVLLVGLGAPLVLYLLIDSETDEPQRLDRSDAESYARDRAAERYGNRDAGDDQR